MTSPSRRKPRTTPRNTCRPEWLRTLLVACGAAALGAFALSTSHAQETSPLDRLRQRSARERWESIRPKYDVVRRERRSPSREREETRTDSRPTVVKPQVRAVSSAQPALRAREKTTTANRQFDVPNARPAVPPELPLPIDDPVDAVETAEPVTTLADPLPDADAAPAPLNAATPERTEQLPAAIDQPDSPSGYDSDPPGFRLTKIGDIKPFADYEPDPALRDTDPCRHQCPRPDGCPEDARYRCPDEYELPLIAGDLRPQQNIGFHWEASNLYSNPLYFDDPALERYGHTLPPIVQPLASAGRFGVQLIAIPYKATIDPYCKKMYALGFYRPGDCAPKQFEPIPFNRDAAIVQGGVTTGAFFLFP